PAEARDRESRCCRFESRPEHCDETQEVVMADSMVEQAFWRMGVRAEVARGATAEGQRVRVDVRRDRDGEYFALTRARDVELVAADVTVDDRHLLLVATGADASVQDSRFLCGFDERSWFVA